MKAIAIKPGQSGVEYLELEEPHITSPHDVKIRILQVGICGTDVEEVRGGRADAPQGDNSLVIGHEMFGQVVETGEKVTKVRPGDYAVFTVRRGCGQCEPCLNNRSDLCYTGDYEERGIKKIHGFETEYIVDEEKHLVKVPESIAHLGVLTEPMSVAQKAIDVALQIQKARFPKGVGEDWLEGRTALVAGVGAIGLLAAFVLRLRGAKVIGLDIVPETSKRIQILKAIGGTYLNGNHTDTYKIDDRQGQIDFIFEATGVAKLSFQLIDALGINGIYVMTGIPTGDRPVCILGAEIMQQIVLSNQVIVGSVNAGAEHFEMGIRDLEKAHNRFQKAIEGMITRKIHYKDFMQALDQRSEDDIKTVVEWSELSSEPIP